MAKAKGREPVRLVQERRRSNAAGLHGDRRLRRLRARGSARRGAIRAQED